ncbi:MAG: flavin reductase family protein [Saprospiraceae bacterium]|nr:flavin reductase family protein [Saprospiraceae bacterium]MDW8483338.1 flavin reductase family protein [Saprospiraceae bacterium]
MLKVDPTQIATKDLHQFILGAVGPRPIAFASTMSADGVPNLAPYSFFNAFSSNPPILIFSSNRRVENNTTKDTLRNVQETGEVVINAVTYAMARQMALCSIEYDANINEFEKAGFTPLPSERVRPFRVAESPVHMECVVENILPLGEKGGAGNLIICRMLLMHISEGVLTPSGRIDPHKIDLIGRLGRFYYARASGEAVFEVVQKVDEYGVGFDALPPSVRHSPVLTGNELARIAALTRLPSREEALADPAVAEAIQQHQGVAHLHQLARVALQQNDVEYAAKLLIASAEEAL